MFGRRRWVVLRAYETLWPFAGAWSAVCTVASLPSGGGDASAFLPSLFDGLAHYHRHGGAVFGQVDPVGFESFVVPPRGAGGDVFYDDNAWLALALVRHHDLTGDPRALSLAQRLLGFVVGGWSSEPAWAHPGGIRWKVPAANRSRNTCANGPGAELAALVNLRTGDQGAGEWAVRIYDWVRQALRRPDDLYADRITPEGVVTSDLWSYNQGTMIGAGVLLHQMTGDESYLHHAVATASAALVRFQPDRLMSQDAAFNAVYFRNLFLLDQVVPEPAYRSTATAYGEAMWNKARDQRTGLFGGGSSFLNNSAPLVELYALLGGAPPHP